MAKSDSGVSLQLVDLSENGVSIKKQENIDESRGYFSITFKDVESKLIGDNSTGWELYEYIINQAAVLFGYEHIVGSQSALDMAFSYAKER